MTPDQILALCDELEDLWRRLPPGPYEATRTDDLAGMAIDVLMAGDGTCVGCMGCASDDCSPMPPEVAAFLARTRYVLPRLLAELRGRLAEEVANERG